MMKYLPKLLSFGIGAILDILEYRFFVMLN
jgi:hypothetical protein